MAEVFIGVPTFRRPDFVREAVASLREQSFSDWRCIVGDNPSDENTGEQVREYVESLGDSRITFVQHEVNAGEYGQGRFFFSAVKDEPFFMILHDDDILNPSYLEKAIKALREHARASLFVANPAALTMDGLPSEEYRRWYLKSHGRLHAEHGFVDILSSVFESGFVPISGTLFRVSDLLESGFVDADCHGNFPFEFNVLLRLGLIHKQGWFDPEELLSFRFHEDSLRSDRLLMNSNVVDTMIKLLERCTLSGRVERRRKVLLGRLFRARATMKLSERADIAGSLKDLGTALRYNPFSVRALSMRFFLALSPAMVRKISSRPKAVSSPPKTKARKIQLIRQ